MNFIELRNAVVKKQKGTFSNIAWAKELPVRKAFSGVSVVKITKGTVRLGVTYDNMGIVQSKRSDGILPTENAGLTWGTWSEFPYFISHKGNTYLRVSLDKANKMSSIYLINGHPSTREQAQMYCLKSAFSNDGAVPDVLSINTNNIISIK